MNRSSIIGLSVGVAGVGLAISDLVWHWSPAWISEWSIGTVVLTGIVLVLMPALWLLQHGRAPGVIGMYLASVGLAGFVGVSKLHLPETWQSAASLTTTAMFVAGSFLTAISEAINRGRVTRDGALGATTLLVLESIRKGLKPPRQAGHFGGPAMDGHEEEQFDVCFSYADEQRDWVETLVDLLRENGLLVHFDVDDKAGVWGKNKIEYFDDLVFKRSRFCLLVVSADYARKTQATHERRTAQARAYQEHREYLLPVRFDDTELPGLLPTVDYVDARSATAEEVARHVRKKIDDLNLVQRRRNPT